MEDDILDIMQRLEGKRVLAAIEYEPVKIDVATREEGKFETKVLTEEEAEKAGFGRYREFADGVLKEAITSGFFYVHGKGVYPVFPPGKKRVKHALIFELGENGRPVRSYDF